MSRSWIPDREHVDRSTETKLRAGPRNEWEGAGADTESEHGGGECGVGGDDPGGDGGYRGAGVGGDGQPEPTRDRDRRLFPQ